MQIGPVLFYILDQAVCQITQTYSLIQEILTDDGKP